MILVDIGPWGRVLDLYPHMDQEAELAKAASIVEGAYESVLSGDLLILRSETKEVILRVVAKPGGNQFNVHRNLQALSRLFPEAGLHVVANYSAGDAGVHRQNLFLPGDQRVRIVQPEVQARHLPQFFDGRVMISSAEQDHDHSHQWNWVREQADSGREFYWNPGTRQIKGGLIKETCDALDGQVTIRQTNEEEAEIMKKCYGRLPHAEWQVQTLGDEGASIEVHGRKIYIPTHPVEQAGRILGDLVNPHPVGCGDAFLAGLIAVRETHPDGCPEWAGHFASFFAGLQYQHSSSNLFSILERLVARREEIPYDLVRGISNRAAV